MDEIQRNKMRIIILGSGSFAGQALFSNLIKNGYEVIGINRSSAKNKIHWDWLKTFDKNIVDYWHEININKNPEKIVDLINDLQPTHIVDFMGQGMVAQSWDDPELWYSTNISKKVFVLEAIRKLKNLEKYVRASTPEVYGSSNHKIEESAHFNPSSPYAISHCSIDYHVRSIGRNFDFPYSIGRFANFYGEGQQLYRVIPKAILSFVNGKDFIVDGNGKSLRSFIYSSDIVSAIKKLLFDAKPFSEFNFSSSEEISILDLVKKISKICKTDFDKTIKFGPERKGKDMIYRLDCNKAQKELNWDCKVSLNEGLKRVYKWISKNNTYFSKASWKYIHKC